MSSNWSFLLWGNRWHYTVYVSLLTARHSLFACQSELRVQLQTKYPYQWLGLKFLAEGQSCRASRGGPQGGCLLGNQTRDFVAVFFIGTPRSSELGSATNEKTQAVGPGFGFLVAGAGLEPTAFGL